MGSDEAKGGANWSSYDQSFREDAHQLLAWGYDDSRSRLTCDLEETEITGFIAESIQARLSSPDIDERFDRYCIKEDNPVPGEGRTGKRRRRLDVIIECTTRPRHKIRAQYVFEGKRLLQPGHPIGDYVGDEGIKRFITTRYAADCPEVAMVGYVQSDAASYWANKLGEQFDKDAADEFRVRKKLSKTIVISDLTDEWESGHLRTNGKSITIHHIFLDCHSPRTNPTT